MEIDMLHNFEHVYIFRDALTGDIIPNFQVKELPREEKREYDYIFEENSDFRHQKPSFIEIGQAAKIRKQLNRMAENLQKDYANKELEANQFSELDESMFEEIDWTLMNDDGEMTLAEKEEVEQKSAKNANQASVMKIVSQTSDTIYVEANIYVDPDFPNRVAVTSPFGYHEDDWFTKHLFMRMKKSSSLYEMVEFFEEEAKEELKDKYPLNNHLNIELFNKYPFIANDEKWDNIRSHIEATTRAYNRLLDGHEDYDTFYLRSQRTLEGLLKYCLEQLPNKREVMKDVSKITFIENIKQVSRELGIEIPSNYYQNEFYSRLLRVANNGGISSKDRALFLAFDAFFNEEKTPSLLFLKNVPDFYRRVNLITNTRNQFAHYNEEENNTQNFEDIKREIDFLLDSLIAHYLISRG